MGWTKDDLDVAIRTSTNYADVIRKLGLAISGASYKSIKRHIFRLNLSVDHFVRPKPTCTRRPIEDVLVLNSPVRGSSLSKIVKRENIFPYICVGCGIGPEYNKKPLTLHLDHKDGNSIDCREDNLRWLCPNCHSQTPTYARSKSSMTVQKVPKALTAIYVDLTCSNCSKPFRRRESTHKYRMAFGAKRVFCSKKCKIEKWRSENGWQKGSAHGTLAGYFKCPKPRCRPCLDAMAEYKRSRRARGSLKVG